jgi:glucuronate isomerase
MEKGQAFVNWILKLGKTVGYSIANFSNLIQALQLRHDFFHEMGCRISDHGTNFMERHTSTEVNIIFENAMKGIFCS